jgi:Transposase DDE domain
VRVPAPCYQLEEVLAARLPHLRPAQRRGLALWVHGTILAHSACQNAVLAALEPLGCAWETTRQRLREWTYDGTERAAPCGTTLEIEGCFAPLLRWVLSWWSGDTLPLAIDATALGKRWVVIAVCVLYRGCAIPVAWHVTPGPGRGPWIAPLQTLLAQLAPAVPDGLTVLVLTDRGLWSPRLWRDITAFGWHPLMRIRPDATFAPRGQPRRPARTLVPGAGHAWVGAGTAFKHRDVRRQGTLVVVWDADQREPWLLLTDLPPAAVGVVWYGLRVWVELGFRVLKSMGWQWERMRRTHAERVARHWLVLAVATLVTLAYGTRVEDAHAHGVAPANLRTPRPLPPDPARRIVSVFTRGGAWLRARLSGGRRLWRGLWLLPLPWPEPSPDLIVIYHESPLVAVAA